MPQRAGGGGGEDGGGDSFAVGGVKVLWNFRYCSYCMDPEKWGGISDGVPVIVSTLECVGWWRVVPGVEGVL